MKSASSVNFDIFFYNYVLFSPNTLIAIAQMVSAPNVCVLSRSQKTSEHPFFLLITFVVFQELLPVVSISVSSSPVDKQIRHTEIKASFLDARVQV